MGNVDRRVWAWLGLEFWAGVEVWKLCEERHPNDYGSCWWIGKANASFLGRQSVAVSEVFFPCLVPSSQRILESPSGMRRYDNDDKRPRKYSQQSPSFPSAQKKRPVVEKPHTHQVCLFKNCTKGVEVDRESIHRLTDTINYFTLLATYSINVNKQRLVVN